MVESEVEWIRKYTSSGSEKEVEVECGMWGFSRIYIYPALPRQCQHETF